MAHGQGTVHRKLMMALMGTGITVLLVTCSVFITYEYLTFRKDIVRVLITRGEIIAANSTAALPTEVAPRPMLVWVRISLTVWNAF